MRVFGAPTSPQVVSKYYFLGKQRVAMRQNGKLTYLHGDHLGSASLATDATGVTLSQQRYLPYGGLRWAQSGSVFPTDWQYTDQQRQSTHLTGIRMVEYYDYRARMYDPKIGRFISPDSVVPDEKNPQSLNRYAYTLGNPVKFTDPSGHCVESPNGSGEVTITDSDCPMPEGGGSSPTIQDTLRFAGVVGCLYFCPVVVMVGAVAVIASVEAAISSAIGCVSNDYCRNQFGNALISAGRHLYNTIRNGISNPGKPISLAGKDPVDMGKIFRWSKEGVNNTGDNGLTLAREGLQYWTSMSREAARAELASQGITKEIAGSWSNLYLYQSVQFVNGANQNITALGRFELMHYISSLFN